MAAGRGAGRRLHVGFAVLLVLAVGAVSVAGCAKAKAKTLDVPATQSAVGGVVADRVGVAAGATSCPGEIPQGKGTVSACTVTLAKGVGVVRVQVRQVDDDAKLDVRLLDAVIDRAKVAADLRSRLKASFKRSFQVDCGTGKRVVKPGGRFKCAARDKNGRRAVLVTVRDAAGTLTFAVLS